MTQSIGIYDYIRVSPICQSLLLILAHAQDSLKVESLCNIVVWWIMTTDSLTSWFIVGPVQYATHTLVHSPWENHPNNTHHSVRNLWFGSFIQLLIHPSHVQCKWCGHVWRENPRSLVSQAQIRLGTCKTILDFSKSYAQWKICIFKLLKDS